MRIITCLGIMGTLSMGTFALEVQTPWVPSKSDPKPKNLARLNVGASVEATWRHGSEAGVPLEIASSLLSEDISLSCPLNQGNSGMILSLPHIQKINKITFRNEGSEGTVRVALASSYWPKESPHWKFSHKATSFSESKVVQIDLGPSEAKYIRLEFTTNKPGQISSLGILGSKGQGDFKLKRQSDVVGKQLDADRIFIPKDALNLDFAGAYTEAKVIYVSSQPADQEVGMMTDDSDETGFAFNPMDQNPTWIVDLKAQRLLNRVVFSLDGPSGSLKLYLLDKLPFSEPVQQGFHSPRIQPSKQMAPLWMMALGLQFDLSGMPGVISTKVIPDSFFKDRTPVADLTMNGDPQTFSLDFQTQSANYLMIRCQPKLPGTGGSSVVVRKISAFGKSELEREKYVLVYEPVSELIAQRNVTTTKTGSEGSGSDVDLTSTNPIRSKQSFVPIPAAPLISE